MCEINFESVKWTFTGDFSVFLIKFLNKAFNVFKVVQCDVKIYFFILNFLFHNKYNGKIFFFYI